jgi:cell wall-associated NlpC family hydrolase
MREHSGARSAIVSEALSWISTPYHDHGTIKGQKGGVDCAQLIKHVMLNVGVVDDFPISYYSPQHFLHSNEERYLAIVRGFAREITKDEALPGDIVLYRIGRVYAHGAIIIDPGWPHIVHAWSAARMVQRSLGDQQSLGAPWREPKFFSAFMPK